MDCLFAPCKPTSNSSKWRNLGEQGLNTIIQRSKENGDGLHLDIESKLAAEPPPQLRCHVSCGASYTSKDHRGRGKRKTEKSQIEPPVRRFRAQVATFNFKVHCLLCGDECKPIDERHPDRWDKVCQCETDVRPGRLTFKQHLLDIGEQRGDAWARDVELRMAGVSDLPAAEAQYHLRCYNKYRKPLIKPAECVPLISDPALSRVIDEMYSNWEQTWTVSELYELYHTFEGQLTSKQMMSNLSFYFDEQILTLRLEGCANVIGFRKFISKSMKLVTQKNEADEEENVDWLVRKVRSEVKAIANPSNYDLDQFTYTKTCESTSETLLTLISQLVSKGEKDKLALTISQCIQQHIALSPNQTTLGLAMKLHHKFGSADIVKLMHEHGLSASYDEVLRFRKSAAKYMADHEKDVLQQVVGLSTKVGPLFGWCDNYDLLVCTPNGRRETHCMAIQFMCHPAGDILTGSTSVTKCPPLIIPRLKKFEASNLSIRNLSSVNLLHYTGPKKIKPPHLSNNIGQPYEDICKLQEILALAQLQDMNWLKSLFDKTSDEPPLEWSGFMTQLVRNQTSISPKAATPFVFGPLIDAPPSHPDTILSTMEYCQNYLLGQGMSTVHISLDMQLYMVALQVKWSDMDRWKTVIVHPGGMHVVMSFLGCIGKLMKGSGLEELLKAAYSGLTGILSGKSWPRAMRALRMVCAALLAHYISQDGSSCTFEDLTVYLEEARKNPTGRLWVDCLMKPTFIVHLFIRAEREGNWLLHHHCLQRMLPYFYAAGHWHYARHISWYLQEMSCLPQDAKTDLIAGAFVCRHSTGVWNSVSADQFGEQTYIRYGKSKGGLVGITLSAEQVACWVLSFPLCQRVAHAFENMFKSDTEEGDTTIPTKIKKHKEEGMKRRKLDTADRNLIMEEFQNHAHPFTDPSQDLINIVNRKVADDSINVTDALVIGEEMERDFVKSLPNGFHNPITGRVKTMEIMKRGIKVGEKTIYDMEALFSRLLIVGQSRNVSIASVFEYELCGVPPSILDEYGLLRKGNKSNLLKRLAILSTEPCPPDEVIVDAGQLLYHIVWPCGGTVSTVATSMETRLQAYRGIPIKVIFDRYGSVSAKDHERSRRAGGDSAGTYNITLTSPLPNREVILKSKANKRLLSHLLCTCTLGEDILMVGEEEGQLHHDEADVLMVSYMLQAVQEGKQVIRILSDDTDVFVILIFWVWKLGINAMVQMEKWDGSVLNINKTAAALGSKSLQLLGMHAVTGCDTVSYPFNKGKLTALNKLQECDFPGLYSVIGEEKATHKDLLKTGQQFFAVLYGQPKCTNMNAARHNIYTKKKGKPPPLKALPPTDPNLLFHMLRSHHQTMLWKAADKMNAPALNIVDFGWEMLNSIPSPMIASGPPAPPDLMKVISCQCKVAGKACAQGNCSCFVSGLSCTTYCHCENSPNECHNPMMTKYGDNADFNAHEEDGAFDENETGPVDLGIDTLLDPLEY